MITPRKIVMLDGIAATGTSSAVGISQSAKISLQFVASGISSGNGVFTVQISNDNVNWVGYNRLTTNATNTNGQTDVRVASVTLNSNTNSFVFVPVSDTFQFMRVISTITTDGAYSAVAYLN